METEARSSSDFSGLACGLLRAGLERAECSSLGRDVLSVGRAVRQVVDGEGRHENADSRSQFHRHAEADEKGVTTAPSAAPIALLAPCIVISSVLCACVDRDGVEQAIGERLAVAD